MRKFHSLAGILAIALITFTSCNKEKVTPPGTDPKPEPTKEELLAGSSQKTWHVTKVYYNGVDKTSEMKACEGDNNYIYKADKTYVQTGGATKCDPMEQSTLETADWWFDNSKTHLNMKYMWNGQTMSLAYVIDELTENSMKLTYTYDNNNYQMVYSAQ
jgi:hypothetical protein